MIPFETTIHLSHDLFTEKERPLIESGPLSASTFKFSTGVSGLRLKNEVGQLVMLPYQGQQIWSADFRGRCLTMKSMFPEPRAHVSYLETYGAFFQHCGFTAMGVPGKSDTHPLHGELPNAAYAEAHLVLGQDDKGAYLGLGGRYQHAAAFKHNYLAQPLVKLYAGSSLFTAAMSITNLRGAEMEFMYLAHINFRPVEQRPAGMHGAVHSGTRAGARRVPPQIVVPDGYREFVEEIARNPAVHTVLRPESAIQPGDCPHDRVRRR